MLLLSLANSATPSHESSSQNLDTTRIQTSIVSPQISVSMPLFDFATPTSEANQLEKNTVALDRKTNRFGKLQACRPFGICRWSLLELDSPSKINDDKRLSVLHHVEREIQGPPPLSMPSQLPSHHLLNLPPRAQPTVMAGNTQGDKRVGSIHHWNRPFHGMEMDSHHREPPR